MVKSCIYQSKKEVYKQFGRKMNQDVDGNRKLFWEEVNKVNGGKMGRFMIILMIFIIKILKTRL